jgi:hypothetical protein
MKPASALVAAALLFLSVPPSGAWADHLLQAKALIRAKKYPEAMTLLQRPEATADEFYQLARVMSLFRVTNPCEAMFEDVRNTLASALKSSPRLRKAARSDPAFRELRGTCMFQRLALGIDVTNPKHLRRLLERVAWEGTNWGTDQPGPQDSLSLSGGEVLMNAQQVHGGCLIGGTYHLEGTTLHIEGVCKTPGRADVPVKLRLQFDPEGCRLTDGDGPSLFDDTPDECNT